MSDISFTTLNQTGPQLASDISVRGYFPTPIAVTTLAHHDVLLRDLLPIIEERSRATPGITGLAPGLWQSNDDFPAWGGKAARVIIEASIGLAKRLSADRHGQPIEVSWRLNASILIRRPGAMMPAQMMPLSQWQIFYQLDDGLAGPDEIPTSLMIDDPRGPLAFVQSPQTGFAMPGAHRPGEAERLLLQRGQIALMPGWLRTGMPPHHGTRAAITVLIMLSA